MIKFTELKREDIVRIEEGTTERIGNCYKLAGMRMVCVDNGIRNLV